MKTAVEWYNSKVIELMTQREQGNIDVLEFRNQLDLLLTEAKEMEKEQMIEFAKYTSRIDTEKSDMNKVIDFYLTLDGEEFVEENFKSE
jgi:hypothetical protein